MLFVSCDTDWCCDGSLISFWILGGSSKEMSCPMLSYCCVIFWVTCDDVLGGTCVTCADVVVPFVDVVLGPGWSISMWCVQVTRGASRVVRSEEHTSELQSRVDIS